jgi:hypothetical protein
MYNGSGWVNNSTLPGWYKCDGSNGTPNLVNKFVRGGATSGGTGGADSQTKAVPLPKHEHTFSGDKKEGTLRGERGLYVVGTSAVFSNAGSNDKVNYNNDVAINTDVKFSMIPTGTISPAGTDNASITIDTVPGYYSVIYIMRVY